MRIYVNLRSFVFRPHFLKVFQLRLLQCGSSSEGLKISVNPRSLQYIIAVECSALLVARPCLL